MFIITGLEDLTAPGYRVHDGDFFIINSFGLGWPYIRMKGLCFFRGQSTSNRCIVVTVQAGHLSITAIFQPALTGHLYKSQVTESQKGLQCILFQPTLTGHLSIRAR